MYIHTLITLGLLCTSTCICTACLCLYIHLYAPAGSVSNDVSAYYENERTISRLKVDTPQEHSHPILLHEDVNVDVPHTYEGIVREVSAIYADAAVNEVCILYK